MYSISQEKLFEHLDKVADKLGVPESSEDTKKALEGLQEAEEMDNLDNIKLD